MCRHVRTDAKPFLQFYIFCLWGSSGESTDRDWETMYSKH